MSANDSQTRFIGNAGSAFKQSLGQMGLQGGVHDSFCKTGGYLENVNKENWSESVIDGEFVKNGSHLCFRKSLAMEGRVAKLREKLEQLLNQTAEVAAELQNAERATTAIPHFSQIEASAHQVGRRLSCRVQTRCANEVAAGASSKAPCLTCGTLCEVATKKRTLDSPDGPVALLESAGKCNRSRRSFFPSSQGVGAE